VFTAEEEVEEVEHVEEVQVEVGMYTDACATVLEICAGYSSMRGVCVDLSSGGVVECQFASRAPADTSARS